MEEQECPSCKHPLSEHRPWFHYKKGYHTRCEVGGIIEPEDVGWQCPCVSSGTKEEYKKRYPNY